MALVVFGLQDPLLLQISLLKTHTRVNMAVVPIPLSLIFLLQVLSSLRRILEEAVENIAMHLYLCRIALVVFGLQDLLTLQIFRLRTHIRANMVEAAKSIWMPLSLTFLLQALSSLQHISEEAAKNMAMAMHPHLCRMVSVGYGYQDLLVLLIFQLRVHTRVSLVG